MCQLAVQEARRRVQRSIWIATTRGLVKRSIQLINPNSSGRFVVRCGHYKPASFTRRAMPVETFRRLIWMNDRLDIHGPVGGTGLRPGDCRWMASRFCTAALLSLFLFLLPCLYLRLSSIHAGYSVLVSQRCWFEPREIASRTVVFHRLIRGRTEDDRRRTPSCETRWRSLFTRRFWIRLLDKGDKWRWSGIW